MSLFWCHMRIFVRSSVYDSTVCLFLSFKLIYLKVTALLFPTSDFRHPVATPALLYIGQALTKVRTVIFNYPLKVILKFSLQRCH